MATINPAVIQWINQMSDPDQVVAYYACQCLQEEVFHAGEAVQAALATVLGEALIAQAKPGQGGAQGAASFRNNVFLTAAAKATVQFEHPARVRCNLARLLGYLPSDGAVPPLAAALGDWEARETARQALECHASEHATGALIAALDSAGPTFCVGVINSLAKRRGANVTAALRKAAEDRQPEVRTAALLALADIPDPAHDVMIANAIENAPEPERRVLHIARARLAEALRASGNKTAARQVYQAILSSPAPEAQKNAARLGMREV